MSGHRRARALGQARAEPGRLAARSARRAERLGAYRALVAVEAGFLPSGPRPRRIVSRALTEPTVLGQCITWERFLTKSTPFSSIAKFIDTQEEQQRKIASLIETGLSAFVNGMKAIGDGCVQAASAITDAFASVIESFDAQTATGAKLDEIGKLVGLERLKGMLMWKQNEHGTWDSAGFTDPEPDDAFRARVMAAWTPPPHK